VRFLFSGDFFSPPANAVDDLTVLVGNEHALKLMPVGNDKPPVLKVHPWPSWLTKGSPRVVDFFMSLFYLPNDAVDSCFPGRCPRCACRMTCTVWEHILSPCRALHTISSDPKWQAFCRVLYLGERGIALFACFPLLYRFHT
jgi:hypothetical protein